MGRKKKEDQEKPKEEGKDGQMMMALQTEKSYVEPDQEVIRADAEKWAFECGLKAPFLVDGPSREDYPKYGHGYALHIREESEKARMATVRYTHEGKRSFWQMDGMITG